ncbi:hypothetical protein jhhlp_003989 [Lomentospora prolificans]|uniref:Secreted protein n=1 Tax=Lomentospora prolificans TaxID=41688 RepID=A0A2N3NAA5_9PEZI|nr:hypothetical protein jhhlp_003989 [Lomentospora prolificans]
MKITTLATLAVTLCTSFASAGMVLIPVFPDQTVQKQSGDCPYGVVTPIGCAPGRPALN